MDQRVVMTTPTTSACAASASAVLATASSLRMVTSPAGKVRHGAMWVSLRGYARLLQAFASAPNAFASRRSHTVGPNTRAKIVSTCFK